MSVIIKVIEGLCVRSNSKKSTFGRKNSEKGSKASEKKDKTPKFFLLYTPQVVPYHCDFLAKKPFTF